MTYDELASALEDAWLAAGLHEHVVEEQSLAERHERSYRAELFADHDEPLPDPPPPWVEVTFRWGPHQYMRGEGFEAGKPPIDLSWAYHVELAPGQARSDSDLARTFYNAVRAAFRRINPNEPPPSDYIDIEVRRTYSAEAEGLAESWVEIVGNSTTDLNDLWAEHDPAVVQEIVREDVQLVAIVLHALHDAFAPPTGNRSGYRSVETA